MTWRPQPDVGQQDDAEGAPALHQPGLSLQSDSFQHHVDDAELVVEDPAYHAFDPDTQPELFSGVAIKRIFAFLIDLVVIAVPVVLGYLFILLFGLLTLGLGWMLFWLAWPASVVWAIVYYGATLGGPHSATIGMMADLFLYCNSFATASSVPEILFSGSGWV